MYPQPGGVAQTCVWLDPLWWMCAVPVGSSFVVQWESTWARSRLAGLSLMSGVTLHLFIAVFFVDHVLRALSWSWTGCFVAGLNHDGNWIRNAPTMKTLGTMSVMVAVKQNQNLQWSRCFRVGSHNDWNH